MCPSARWRRPAPRRWCCGGTRNPARSSTAGIARCPPSRPSSANSPSSVRKRKTGHDQRGGPVHGAAQRGGELGVGHRRRPGQVHRARHIVVRDREQQRAHLVLETDPRHVLAPVAQSGAEPEREQRLDPAQHPAATATAPARCAPAPPGCRRAQRTRWPPPSPHRAGPGNPSPAGAVSSTVSAIRCRRSSRPRWR